MDQEIFNTTINNIQEKIGEETVAKIADDLGIIKTAQNQALAERQELEQKLADAEQARQEMQQANARLLQQIPMNDPINNFGSSTLKEPEEKKEFDPRSAFDVNGKIKR